MPRGPELTEGSQDAFPPRDVRTVGSEKCRVSPRPLSLVRQPARVLSQWQRYPRIVLPSYQSSYARPEVELRPRKVRYHLVLCWLCRSRGDVRHLF